MSRFTILEGTRLNVLVLTVTALLLYGAGFGWGIPSFADRDRSHSWGVDAPIPLGPLADIHNIIEPQPDRNLGYPMMYPFMIGSAYAPYLGYLFVTGQFGEVESEYPFGLADPVAALTGLIRIALSVSLLMGAGVVVAAHQAGRALWDEPTAVLAGLVAMVAFPMFYYSRTGNVDVPALFFSALALAVFARILARGFTLGRAIWLGAFVGFAAGTKEQMAALFIGLPLALLWIRRQETEAAWVSTAFWTVPAAGAAAAFVTFGLGSGLFVDPERFFAHLAFNRERMQALASGHIYSITPFPFTAEGHLGFIRQLGGYLGDILTPAGIVLAVLGIFWVLWREPRKGLFVVPAATYLLVLFLSARASQLRYLLPAAFVLALFAARAVTLSRSSRWAPVRIGLLVLALAAVGLNLLRGIDLTYAMVHDSRYAAAEWIAERARPGDRLEMFGGGFGLLPNTGPDILLAQAADSSGFTRPPRIGPEAVREIAAGWAERRPQFIAIQPDHTSADGAPYAASCPPAVFAALMDGSLGYEEGAYFETPPLLPWVRRPDLDYPTVNPPIRIFVPVSAAP